MDSQWRPVSDDTNQLLRSLLPPFKAERFSLKGKKLFYGVEHGNAIFTQIRDGALSILAKHKVPIFYGAVSRIGYQQLQRIMDRRLRTRRTDPHVRSLSGDTHNAAFFSCASHVDRYIHTGFPTEQVLWIAAKSKADLRLKDGLKDFRAIAAADLSKVLGGGSFIFHEEPHIAHIADTIYFGEMNDSRALQLADLCCSTITRALRGDRWGRGFYKLIKLNVVSENPPSFAGLATARRAVKALDWGGGQ
jgi:hypothetical protein